MSDPKDLKKECINRYEDIDVKSDTLDVNSYCKLRKGKKCPNLECNCLWNKLK